ncbi:hypothetical protein VFA_004293 [Vibrio furnissii CIP 102972]|nr:hypothetical protein vfu_A00884 [Vibrio furnissii NCTC 11218]EEX39017.1 hypothetical protein VFA_004293 [Vibrio furnissii CIP 102972]
MALQITPTAPLKLSARIVPLLTVGVNLSLTLRFNEKLIQ